jgi:DNA-binding beta-propeller fold protein YncE
MQDRKHSIYVFLVIFCLLFSLTVLYSREQETLAEMYRSGEIKLTPVLTLSDESMPEDVFFESQSDLTFDSEDNIYIADSSANNIKVFDPEGQFIKTLGRKGQGPGEFQMPYHLAVSEGRIVVWELGNRRLSVLTESGEFLKSVQMSPTDGWPRKICFLPNGNFVIERLRTFYGDNEKPQECFIEIYSPELESKKTIYTQSVWRNKYITSPVRTNVPQPFASLVYWDVAPDGKIVIGYSEKYTIDIFDSEKGKLFDFSHTYDPIKVTKEDKTNFFESITSTSYQGGIKKGAPDYIVENTKFPKYKPAFLYIIVDGEGNILVFSYSEGITKEARSFDAFDPEGHFISRVQVKGTHAFPPYYSSLYRRGEYFWIKETTEQGMYQIVKYEVSEFD